MSIGCPHARTLACAARAIASAHSLPSTACRRRDRTAAPQHGRLSVFFGSVERVAAGLCASGICCHQPGGDVEFKPYDIRSTHFTNAPPPPPVQLFLRQHADSVNIPKVGNCDLSKFSAPSYYAGTDQPAVDFVPRIAQLGRDWARERCARLKRTRPHSPTARLTVHGWSHVCAAQTGSEALYS